MELNVDLDELIAEARRGADVQRTTMDALPRGWVLPAGTDPISAQWVPQLNEATATVLNMFTTAMNRHGRTVRGIGEAIPEYALADSVGARRLGGGGGDVPANPAPDVQEYAYRRPPAELAAMPVVNGDPLTTAHQLHDGPGPEAVYRFVESVREFNTAVRPQAMDELNRSASVLQNWTPVGTEVAQRYTTHGQWLGELGGALDHVANSAERYGDAFPKARKNYPTPSEIRKARQDLVRAHRSGNEAAIAAATAHYEEIMGRATEAGGTYVSDSGFGAAESGSKPPAAEPSVPGAGGAEAVAPGTGTGTGTGQSQDMSQLMQMMPYLMQMMSTGMDGLPTGDEGAGAEFDDYYDDYGLGSTIPSFAGSLGSGGSGGGGGGYGGGGSGGSAESISSVASSLPLTGVPTVSSGLTGGGLPRVPTGEAVSAGAARGGAAGTAGSPMMPYAPMGGMGGAGQGGGSERSRVVAWHPDRLMYVDDTPHTDPVIGERPTIAPTVTQPTPPPAHQAPTRSGGNP